MCCVLAHSDLLRSDVFISDFLETILTGQIDHEGTLMQKSNTFLAYALDEMKGQPS